MAEINVERKTSVWTWIIAAIVVVLLAWALLGMMGRDDADTTAAAPVVTDALQTAPGATGTTPGLRPSRAPTTASTLATGPSTAEQRDAALDRYAGTYGSGNLQLDLSSAGTYTMRDSPAAGEDRGRWSFDASASVLRLISADGSQARNFRVEGLDTLTPVEPEGDPAAQMAPLQRVVDR